MRFELRHPCLRLDLCAETTAGRLSHSGAEEKQ